jgi:hypothetical protein
LAHVCSNKGDFRTWQVRTLRKPIAPNILLATVAELLGGNQHTLTARPAG